MTTRQEARERYGLRTTVYLKGYEPFRHPGNVKLIVKCPRTLISRETEWISHVDADDEFDRLVWEVVCARQSIPPPPKPVRFHQPFDF